MTEGKDVQVGLRITATLPCPWCLEQLNLNDDLARYQGALGHASCLEEMHATTYETFITGGR